MSVPVIRSERLLLRMITESDAPFFFALNNDPEVLKYTGDEPFENIEEATAFIRAYSQYRLFSCGRMAVQNLRTGELLGWCGLKFHEDNGETDIGYRFMRRYWNQGYATEAAKAAIMDGKDRLKLTQVVAHVQADNHASFRVCEKLHMRFDSMYEWGGCLWHKLRREL